MARRGLFFSPPSCLSSLLEAGMEKEEKAGEREMMNFLKTYQVLHANALIWWEGLFCYPTLSAPTS